MTRLFAYFSKSKTTRRISELVVGLALEIAVCVCVECVFARIGLACVGGGGNRCERAREGGAAAAQTLQAEAATNKVFRDVIVNESRRKGLSIHSMH